MFEPQEILLLLASASLRSAALAVVVVGVGALCRVRRPALRHLLGRGLLVGMLAAPILELWAPALPLDLPAPAPLAQARSLEEAVPVPAAIRPTLQTLSATVRVPAAAEPAVDDDAPLPWATFALGLYLAGAALLLLRLAGAVYRVRRLVRGAAGIEDETCRRTAADAAGRPVAVRTHPAVRAPLTAGWRRPVILLPAAWNRWEPATLRAVLTHEAAHARRGDTLTALLASLNCCVSWFHPLAWILRRDLRRTAEQTCDAAVLAAAEPPSRYARCLVELAAALGPDDRKLLPAAAPFGGGDPLARRLQAILDPRAPLARPMGRVATTAVVALLAAAIAGASTLRPTTEITGEPRPETSRQAPPHPLLLTLENEPAEAPAPVPEPAEATPAAAPRSILPIAPAAATDPPASRDSKAASTSRKAIALAATEGAFGPIVTSGDLSSSARRPDRLVEPQELLDDPAIPTRAARHFVLFFDRSPSPSGIDRSRVRLEAPSEGARAWIEDGLVPGDRVAIASYKGGLRLHCDFTDDRSVLDRALSQVPLPTRRLRDAPPRAARARPSLLTESDRLDGGRVSGVDRDVMEGLGWLADRMRPAAPSSVLIVFSRGVPVQQVVNRTAAGPEKDYWGYPPPSEVETIAATLRAEPISLYVVGPLSPADRAVPSGLSRLLNLAGGGYLEPRRSSLAALETIDADLAGSP